MNKIDIFVFGDSLAYGLVDNELGGWVNRLRLILENQEKGNVINVFNLSISGEITEETLERFEAECKARYDKDRLTIIIFAIGINDTQVINGNDKVSLSQFATNIHNLITQAKKYTEKIVSVGLASVEDAKLAPAFWNNNKSYFNSRIIKFDSKLESVCNEENISYVKVYDMITLDDLFDGMHPNIKGHKKICDVMLERITEILND